MNDSNLIPVTAQAEQLTTHGVVNNGIGPLLETHRCATPDSKCRTKFLL